ncbi:MAG: GNAT family N-acetyltransferase [candidate division WOR-3 bacterium]
MNKNKFTKNLEIKPFIPGNEETIVNLLHTTFGISIATDFYRWRFLDNPAGPGICDLVWDGNKLCAHHGVTLVNIVCDGKELRAGLGGTAMTHPDYRGQGLFTTLYKRAVARMISEGLILFYAFPNSASHPLIVDKLGFIDIYEVPKFSLNFRNRRQRTADRSDKYIEELKKFDERFDRLWFNAGKEYRVIVKRDSRYLNWRFVLNPIAQYRILSYSHQSDLLGYAVLKQYNQELQIVDLLTVPQTDIGLALVTRAIDIAQEESLESVSMWLNPANPLHIELERLGFKPGAPVVYFGGKVLNSSSPDSPFYSYRNWHLMMSDSDVF